MFGLSAGSAGGVTAEGVEVREAGPGVAALRGRDGEGVGRGEARAVVRHPVGELVE
jgi:hypothetical protein